MSLAACLVLVVALSSDPDVSQLIRFAFQQGQPADPDKSAPQGTLPSPVAATAPEKKPAQGDPAQTPHAVHLTESSRIQIIREISGEFVRAQIALPGGKEGYHISANQPSRANSAKQADAPSDSPHVFTIVRAPAIHQGDKVQITRLEFREKSIVLDLNGGGKQKWHFRDHVELTATAPITASGGPLNSTPSGNEGQGSTVYLDFGRKLPDLTPGDVKLQLASVLDFSPQRSAAAQYAESLPKEFQQAIKNRIAAVGMDHEMVLAAMGRPDRKVRERDADGNETEDWIYGNPPGRTVFVTFIGEKVVRVRQFD